MSKRAYLRELSAFAFERTLHRTDTASLFVGLLVPAVLTVSGRSVTDTTNLIAWLVIGSITGVSLGRFIAAPYFVWRRQNEKIVGLEMAVAKEVSRADVRAREIMGERLVRDRRKLAEKAIDLKADAWVAADGRAAVLKISEQRLLSGLFTVDPEFDAVWKDFIREAARYADGKPKRQAEETDEAYKARETQHLWDSSAPLDAATKRVVDWLLYRD
jgi:hypothetical protein